MARTSRHLVIDVYEPDPRQGVYIHTVHTEVSSPGFLGASTDETTWTYNTDQETEHGELQRYARPPSDLQ